MHIIITDREGKGKINMNSLFEMINKRVDKMSIETVTSWVMDISERMDVINQQIEETDICNVPKVIYLLEQQNDLELCLELLDERVNDLLDQQLNAMIDLLEYFTDECKC